MILNCVSGLGEQRLDMQVRQGQALLTFSFSFGVPLDGWTAAASLHINLHNDKERECMKLLKREFTRDQYRMKTLGLITIALWIRFILCVSSQPDWCHVLIKWLFLCSLYWKRLWHNNINAHRSHFRLWPSCTRYSLLTFCQVWYVVLNKKHFIETLTSCAGPIKILLTCHCLPPKYKIIVVIIIENYTSVFQDHVYDYTE